MRMPSLLRASPECRWDPDVQRVILHVAGVGSGFRLDIARALCLCPEVLSDILDDLEQKGLVIWRESSSGIPGRIYSLSIEGMDAAEKLSRCTEQPRAQLRKET